MPGSFPLNALRACRRVDPAPFAAFSLLLALCMLLLAPTRATSQETQFQPSWYMVLDRANLLDEVQERSAIDDAWRLNTIGTPTQVVTELAQSTPELASQRARELRLENRIESSPGADDGLLVYAAVNPGDRSIVEVGVSLGVNAVPRGGFTISTADGLRTGIIEPQLEAGHPARAIVYSLREIHYLQIFTPPPVDPLTGWRSTLHTIVPYIAPVVAAAGFALLWLHLREARNLRQSAVPLTIATAGALALAVIAMFAHSPIGVLSAFVLGASVIWFAMLLDRTQPSTYTRTVTVTPRPPGRFRPLTRTISK